MAPRNKPIKLFISYSHKNASDRERFEVHLAVPIRQGLVEVWHDRMIIAGADWGGTIDEHLNSADIIVFLVSADFVASAYVWDCELARALERHDRDEAVIVPIIVAPVYWKGAPFGRLKMLPPDARPISLWRNRDHAWSQTATAVCKLAEAVAAGKKLDRTSSGAATVISYSSAPLLSKKSEDNNDEDR